MADTATLPTVAQVAGMSPAQRAATMAKLSPAQQQQMQAQMIAARNAGNHAYLARSLQKVATCPPVSGGISQNFTAGQTLIYNLPTIEAGFAKELLVTFNLTVNCAAGTGATYAANPAAPYSLVDEIEIDYNGVQGRARPYLAKLLAQFRGYGRGAPGQVLAGTNDTSIQNLIDTGTPVATGNNTWIKMFRLPLSALHDLRPEGMLPIMGSNTKGQVKLRCSSAPLGPDPLLNAVAAAGGTGNAVTVTGTVTVEVIYTDGINYQSPSALALDLSGLGTAQYVIDTPLQPLPAGNVVRQRISSLLEHYYAFAVVIDGQQSSKFATVGNIQSVELDRDSVGQNKFWQLGAGTNQAIADFYEQLRSRVIGQDLDEGVIPLVYAPPFNQYDPDNGEGLGVLNMKPGGWTDVNYGVKVGAVGGVANINPRVELFLVSHNPAGLQGA